MSIGLRSSPERNSWRTAGLLSSGVIEDAERIFRQENVKEEMLVIGDPGFRLMSPERIRRIEKRKLV